MHDFANNFRAISISYASTDTDIMIYDTQRRVFEYFSKYLFSGACFKKDTMRWLLCKYWGYSNSEIQKIFEEKYNRRMSLSSIAATKTAVNDTLRDLFGEDFFDYFCEYATEKEAYEAARKAVARINAVKSINKKSDDLFVEDVTEPYYDSNVGAVKVYSIEELETEIELLACLSKTHIKAKLDSVDMKKINYLLFMIDSFTTKNEKVNKEKLEILEAIENRKSMI